MRHPGKSAFTASALALALWVGSPLLAGEGHDHKCSDAKHDAKEAKCDEGKDGSCGHGCHHGDKHAKAGDKPCADHADCKSGDKPCADHAGCKHANAGDKPCGDHADCKHCDAHAKAGDKGACADSSCCKDGASCCEGDGKACAEKDEDHAG